MSVSNIQFVLWNLSGFCEIHQSFWFIVHYQQALLYQNCFNILFLLLRFIALQVEISWPVKPQLFPTVFCQC